MTKPVILSVDDEIYLNEKYPKIIKVLLTGLAGKTTIERTKKQANLYACLDKPWENQVLLETIKSGLLHR